MSRIRIIVGSTQQGRKAAAVADWVYEILKCRKDAEFEVVDIGEYKLPLLDDPVSKVSTSGFLRQGKTRGLGC